jgi:tRNA-Thr(GGU) m(6)t(6)A37 methyltransferase TsaA
VGIINTLRNLWPFGKPLIRREPISYNAIGVVRNRIRDYRTEGWETARSDIFLSPDLEPALEGIDGFSHLIVVFHMHRIGSEHRPILRLPLPGENRGEIGLFATRIAVRPNAMGIAVVPVVWRRKNVVRVMGLDALDGSPVLDLKPYLPRYDSVADAALPDWALAALDRPPADGDPQEKS